ncbi:uncharacterized protein RCC_07980 [Ramularia collo-cygni]|uniref:Uncharacterized protein n=1 Tax=Ramularia collo-cygni TaxID=112498 RepID=A0A2D3UYX3_9PEZI|nr:uncharacterized protein RCC_07980 [Ramularia collo-cygni]CZT22111.1 uncharacterized protein RCC_07980 [Ramularia collo-cygni]
MSVNSGNIEYYAASIALSRHSVLRWRRSVALALALQCPLPVLRPTMLGMLDWSRTLKRMEMAFPKKRGPAAWCEGADGAPPPVYWDDSDDGIDPRASA